jgi:hypothetical protein
MKDTETIMIYVSLLEEGTPTIRPTQAISLGQDRYKLLLTDRYDPYDETWEFLPGSVVRCIHHKSDDGMDIIWAVEKISDPEISTDPDIQAIINLVRKYDVADLIAGGANNNVYDIGAQTLALAIRAIYPDRIMTYVCSVIDEIGDLYFGMSEVDLTSKKAVIKKLAQDILELTDGDPIVE